MANQMAAINSRIRSVKSTRKIVRAMSLVSTAKLQKSRARVAANIAYSGYYRQVIDRVSHLGAEAAADSIYFRAAAVANPLHIVITSNSGLCGAYNDELLKYVARNIPHDEPIFAIGSYGIKRMRHDGFLLVKTFDKLENIDQQTTSLLIYDIMELYRHGEVSSIDIIYTHYINTLTFRPARYSLLPLTIQPAQPAGVQDTLLMEPSRAAVLDELVPLYVSALVYNTLLESKISEHAARRAAMESANRNAEQLLDELTLKRNQARQEAITQEVTEITSGSQGLGRKDDDE